MHCLLGPTPISVTSEVRGQRLRRAGLSTDEVCSPTAPSVRKPHARGLAAISLLGLPDDHPSTATIVNVALGADRTPTLGGAVSTGAVDRQRLHPGIRSTVGSSAGALADRVGLRTGIPGRPRRFSGSGSAGLALCANLAGRADRRSRGSRAAGRAAALMPLLAWVNRPYVFPIRAPAVARSPCGAAASGSRPGPRDRS